MNRNEHVDWCKQRALEYIEQDDLASALASMGSDLNKHPDTEGHPGIQMDIMLLAGGQLDRPDQMRKFIQGFN